MKDGVLPRRARNLKDTHPPQAKVHVARANSDASRYMYPILHGQLR